MDLEQINYEYMELKQFFNAKNEYIDILKNKVVTLLDDKTIAQAKLIKAKRSNDDMAIYHAENKLEKIEEEIFSIQIEALKQKLEVEKIQEKLDAKINELMQNPEMQKHLNDVLAKRYDRKLAKLSQERDALSNTRDTISSLAELSAKSPIFESNLKDLLLATKNVQDLQNELDALNASNENPERVEEIVNKLLPEANTKLDESKKVLFDFIARNNLNINENDILDFASNGYVEDKDGNIDLDTTFSKNISSLNREIKGYDKSIRNYEIALEKVTNGPIVLDASYSQENNLENDFTNQQSFTQQVSTPINTINMSGPSINQSANINLEQPANQEKEEEKDLRWYQKVVEKVKEIYTRITQPKLDSPKVEAKTEPQINEAPVVESKKAEENKFVDSLKYDIVKDLAKNMEQKHLKEAKAQRKTENNQER